MARDYREEALRLLHPHLDDPPLRARRASGVYAALYLEDPLMFSWCGLASFVARQVYWALETGGVGYRDMLGNGNLQIYASIIPDILRFRDGVPITGRLSEAFTMLRGADLLARTDGAQAEEIAYRALVLLCDVEQQEIVQPGYDALSDAQKLVLGEFVSFRLSWDTAGQVLKFRGHRATDVEDRVRWMRQDVLPAWRQRVRECPEWVRSDCERFRREGEVMERDLPRRLGF